MTFYRGEYAERGFCGRCGSNFFFRYHNENYPHSEKNEIAFARACFDSDLPKQDASHIFFKEKKDWYIVHDDLPKRD